MRERVHHNEIRKGDRIRVEIRAGGLMVFEYVASRNGEDGGIGGSAVQHFLLDRPAPAVDLPTDGTHLGWLTHGGERFLLAFDFRRRNWIEDASFGAVSRESAEAWVPAVAVPKAALDELRNTGFFTAHEHVRRRITDFLAAVDAANGADQ